MFVKRTIYIYIYIRYIYIYIYIYTEKYLLFPTIPLDERDLRTNCDTIRDCCTSSRLRHVLLNCTSYISLCFKETKLISLLLRCPPHYQNAFEKVVIRWYKRCDSSDLIFTKFIKTIFLRAKIWKNCILTIDYRLGFLYNIFYNIYFILKRKTRLIFNLILDIRFDFIVFIPYPECGNVIVW
jgi:hypothetical protein